MMYGGNLKLKDESVFINNPRAHANTLAQTHTDVTNKFKESGGFLLNISQAKANALLKVQNH
jgi:hypothetical protein